ncbi:Nucleolar protein 12 [Phlyctochytrium planicorne]|nr:Nucleolar protein 12 [Phlyctochytrium planicorne]
MFSFVKDTAIADQALNSIFEESKQKTEKNRSIDAKLKNKSGSKASKISETGVAQDGEPVEAESEDDEATKKLKDEQKTGRTVFVGNLPISVADNKTLLKKLKKLLGDCGKLESIRFRSIAFADTLPKKVGYLTKNFHPGRDSLNAYAVFAEKDSVEKALSLNGALFEDKHLRVDSVGQATKYDLKKCIFIGNLAFDIAEEVLWKFFEKIGDIENVRVVRDRKTNVGKGFAYVQFKQKESVGLALEYHDTELNGRKMRIQRCAKPKALGKLEGNRSSTTKVKRLQKKKISVKKQKPKAKKDIPSKKVISTKKKDTPEKKKDPKKKVEGKMKPEPKKKEKGSKQK